MIGTKLWLILIISIFGFALIQTKKSGGRAKNKFKTKTSLKKRTFSKTSGLPKPHTNVPTSVAKSRLVDVCTCVYINHFHSL